MTPRPPPKLRDYPGIYGAGLALVILTMTTLLCCRVFGSEVPQHVLAGLARVESSSYFRPDGSLRYVNQARGKDGEVGPFQALPATLRQHGFSPSLYEQDRSYSLMATRAILCKYHQRVGNWHDAIACWHRPYDYKSTRAQSYARKVAEAIQ